MIEVLRLQRLANGQTVFALSGRMKREHIVELKKQVEAEQRTMLCIGVGDQQRVRQVLAQHTGISNRDHGRNPVHHETLLSYFGEISEALASEIFPGTRRQ